MISARYKNNGGSAKKKLLMKAQVSHILYTLKTIEFFFFHKYNFPRYQAQKQISR